MIMFETTFSLRWSWQKLFSYGEVVCFISAWAVGLLLAMQGERPSEQPGTRTFASATDTFGLPETLLR
jgi:hypothetical protein